MEIVIAIIGSGLLSAVVSGLIGLYSKHMDRKYVKEDKAADKGDEMENVKKQLAKAEKDNVRLQMLVLMADYPEDESELMRVAEHYFKELKGNWYMTTMFNHWIEEKGIAKPDWLEKE